METLKNPISLKEGRKRGKIKTNSANRKINNMSANLNLTTLIITLNVNGKMHH